ncbi:MAG TPA: ABC transporter transmembrane domain-containing protein [Beijerinckiaceae bacterium]|jgi:putative ABC transport system ATP-binding protein
MDKSLFRYIWRHSRRDQLIIFAVVLASLPFYFASLDLPRRIVNEAIQGKAFEGGRETVRFLDLGLAPPSWLGGARIQFFEGFDVSRMGLLFGLSGLFLFYVLINGGFKFWINLAKGALGERMLRRMRFELFSYVLRFAPDTLRTVRSSEAATIIKDEVEPIGGFIGDAFVLPLFLGTQAATALIFILVQSVWLGLLAAAMVGVQFTVIPRLRRELLRLGKQRQLASRRLAGRVGEVVDGMEAVHVHDAHRWERAEIGDRLFHLFDLRYKIYRRKFMVKFLNNLLAQVTPFLFYAIGGYFALTGRLDIGQLVAVIGAYRELPPPLKELIDWDQQRLDVQVKYDQVVQYFAAEKLLPDGEPATDDADGPLEGPLKAEGLMIADPHGGTLVEGAAIELPLPARVGLLSEGAPTAGLFARVLAGRSRDYGGTVAFGERHLADLPPGLIGQRFAYAGVEPVLFPGSLRDNLVYGLRRRPPDLTPEQRKAEARRIMEAMRTGNPVESVEGPWIDCARAGASDLDDLDRLLIEALHRIGLGEDLYRFGLAGRVDPARDPDLPPRLIEARLRLRERLAAQNMADLVEPFDPARFNRQATVAENLLFGVPTSRALLGRDLAEHPAFRGALDAADLTRDLVRMGERIAETMTEIFRGLPQGHPLFEQFSFLGADELPDYEALLTRRRSTARRMARREDETRLLALPLAYIEPRHRLGLLDDAMRERLVAGRDTVRAALEKGGDPGVAFYEPDDVNGAAPVRDNLLFGRVNQTAANAQARVMEMVSAVVDELDLRVAVERVGLDHQVGPAGRLLSAPQRACVNLVRCIVKRPDVFVVDGGLAPLGEARARAVLKILLDGFAERTLFVTLANERDAEGFDALIRFGGGGATVDIVHDQAGTEPAVEVVEERKVAKVASRVAS